jgi:glycosyltransferase involved in cell wall biosynthesis
MEINNTMPASPEISVIIPTYNAGEYISECIKSVLDQNCERLEVIIVDDCSSDNTREIVEKFDETNVTYHCLSENFGGPAKPRNTGLKLARGKYLVMLDSDDLLLPNSIEHRVNALRNDESLGFVFCDGIRFSEAGDYDHTFLSQHDYFNEMIPVKNEDGLTKVSALEAYRALAKGDYILPSGLAMHANIFSNVGLYDESVTNGQDLDMSLKITKDFPIAYIDIIGFKQRVHEDSISKKGHKLAFNRLELLEKHLKLCTDELATKAFKNKIAINHSIIGRHYQTNCNMKMSRRHYLSSLQSSFKLNVFKLFLITLLGKTFYKKLKSYNQ